MPIYDRTWLIDTTLHDCLHESAGRRDAGDRVLLSFWEAAGRLHRGADDPLSLLATFIGLTLRGIPANLLSLGAMDFGIIVDGAVIVVENIFRKLAGAREHSRLKRDRRREASILDATTEVGRPTFFSMLIIIAAHIPIFTLQRHEGRIFAPMAWTVTSRADRFVVVLALAGALALLFLFAKRHLREREAVVRLFKRIYRPSLTWALAYRAMVVFMAVLLLSASIGCSRALAANSCRS